MKGCEEMAAAEERKVLEEKGERKFMESHWHLRLPSISNNVVYGLLLLGQ